MNKTKRRLELGSAITSIVINGIMAIIMFITALFSGSMGDLLAEIIASAEQAELSAEMAQGLMNIVVGVLIVAGVFCVVNVVLASILCTAPAQDGKGGYKKRRGISITHICFNGIMCLFFIDSFFPLIVYIAIVVFGIVSVCLKHPVVNTFETKDTDDVSAKLAELNRMKSAGFINEEEYNSALERIYTTAESSQKNFTVEEKLAELKKCKEMGVITEEQYEQRVKEIIDEI